MIVCRNENGKTIAGQMCFELVAHSTFFPNWLFDAMQKERLRHDCFAALE